MATEILKLTAQIVISHASMSELTPKELVEEIKELYNLLSSLEGGLVLPEEVEAEKYFRSYGWLPHASAFC